MTMSQQTPVLGRGFTPAPERPVDLMMQERLAHTFAAQGRFADAAACWREVLRQRPTMAAAHNNLGSALRLLGQNEAAADSFKAALQLDPHSVEASNNLGVTLCLLGQLEQGEAWLRRAVELQPDYARAHYNLGNAQRSSGNTDAAAESFQAALRLAPDLVEAHHALAAVQLLDGRMPEAWAGLEWRRLLPGRQLASPHAMPFWRGEPLGQRVLLLELDGGYGDIIQFCRYVPPLAPVMQIVLRVPRPLLRLMRGLADVTVVAADDPLPPCDVQCDLMSLPFIFGTRLDTIPSVLPYLRADPVQIAVWQARLAHLPGLRVGLAWAGNPTYAEDRRRSIDPARFAALAGIPGISLVSLQVGGARPPASLGLYDATDILFDFADTAALIAALDLVIAVDTAVVHLAGALNKPVWLLNRFDTDWRWLRGRSDSPWYPTLRQFRQPAPDDWDSVLQSVRTALLDMPERPGSAAAIAWHEAFQRQTAGRAADAEQAYRDILKRWPEHYPSLHQLAIIAMDARQPEAAVDLLCHAVRLQPQAASAISNLGNAFRGVGAAREGMACLQEALRLQPDHPPTMTSLGLVMQELNDFAGSEPILRRAVELQPDYAASHGALGWLLLQTGRFEEGWQEFRWRRGMPHYVQRQFPGREWRGEELGGQRLLVYSDEGHGDAIQCIRYLPLPGIESVILEVQPGLVRLFRSVPGIGDIVARGKTLPPFDLYVGMLDLPELFHAARGTIPLGIPYLQADPMLSLQWHRRLANLPGLRVGIVWAGSPTNFGDRHRSMPLARLQPLLTAFPDISFVSLQKGPAREQIAALPACPNLHDFTDRLMDFADTAALIEALDLVIGVDTAVVHLSGALGKPVWLLNRFCCDWRWGLGRTDSIWYPTLRQFHQSAPGDWDSIVTDVVTALERWREAA